jgi:deoxyribodipyrimidine photo-lyase
MTCVIHWFRDDLRLSDNIALSTAAAEAHVRGVPLLPVHVQDPTQSQPTRWLPQRVGPHRQAWLMGNLKALDAELRSRGSRLLWLSGKPETVLPGLASLTQALTVHAQDCPAPEEAEQAERIAQALQTQGGTLQLHKQCTMLPVDALPFEPGALPDVFTVFRQQVEHSGIQARKPWPAPFVLPAVPELSLPWTWAATPVAVHPDSRSSFPFHQNAFGPGERGAQSHLGRYMARHLPHRYKATRNGLTGLDFSSKFSPWLATGALSAAQVIEALRAFENENGTSDSSYWLWFELLWRDHFRLLHLKHGKALYRARGLSQALTPSHDAVAFERWCAGQTGEPLVDAGMRELAATGWLSNRMRQIVASHLVHDLACDWRAGAAWFEHCLIDFDVYSNQGNWLYVAGRGTDPRGGRRFNPDKQTREHDPDGRYRRLWGTA